MAAFSADAATSLLLASTPAEAKASKAAVHYQDHPSGMRMGHMCKFYLTATGGRSRNDGVHGHDGNRSLSSRRRPN